MTTIQKKIPIPTVRRGERKVWNMDKLKYPYHKLEVGDSFGISIKGLTKSQIYNVRGYIYSAKSNKFTKPLLKGKKFTARTINNEIRVWRIK